MNFEQGGDSPIFFRPDFFPSEFLFRFARQKPGAGLDCGTRGITRVSVGNAKRGEMIDRERLIRARDEACRELLSRRNADGLWVGRLSDSALSTATAISALAMVDRHAAEGEPWHDRAIDVGIDWLVAHQNGDGGWGDTDRSFSNLATTMLVRAAFHLAGRAESNAQLLREAETYFEREGGLDALRRRYGKDKTFVVPILTNAALAGLIDWREVSPLPFELACLPHATLRLVGLPVVSYAIPALVAIGQVRFYHRKPWNPLTRTVRRLAVGRSLQKLEEMQPASGGFLEAAPLTSFVTMSLASTGRADDPVVRRAVRFLEHSQRENGAWPIDENLATWLTTQAIVALPFQGEIDPGEIPLRWLLSCQHLHEHPFTHTGSGGWGWTDRSGAVPDVDDTAAALLALARLADYPATALHESDSDEVEADQRSVQDAAAEAIQWLLELQNGNGGWPTFCRGWGKMPFDRSSTDLTAHALRALHAWRGLAPSRINSAIRRGFRFLECKQRPDGCWLPLWFGNQHLPEETNPYYGTARVLAAYRDFDRLNGREVRDAVGWLEGHQNSDGGWGGDPKQQSSVEETALVVEALASIPGGRSLELSLEKGVNWLLDSFEAGRHREASPIGLYFAKLWYYEELYPLIFLTAALRRTGDCFSQA